MKMLFFLYLTKYIFYDILYIYKLAIERYEHVTDTITL